MPQLPPADAAVIAVRRAMREGATEAEAYVVWVRGYRATARASRVESLEAVDDAGLGVRVAVGRRVGFAYASSLDRARVEEAVKRAIAVARASPEDPHWSGFPEPSDSYPEPEAIFEPSLAEVGPETVVEKVSEAKRVVEEAKAILVSASASVTRVERAIANSHGVYRIDVGTHAVVAVDVAIETDGYRTPAVFHVESSRTVIPSAEDAASRALEKARLCLRKVSVTEPKRMAVVFTPQAFSELIAYTVGVALRGDSVVQGRSPYAGRLGTQVASEKITIVDDGTLKGGDNSWRFDGEGVATRRKTLIERGVLKGFVADNYWGKRLGMSSTGNAVRSGYESPPMPGFTNIIFSPGDAQVDELLEGEVLVVYDVQGAHSSNPETGEYSVLANPAILYRNGEAVGWAPGVMVSSNIYEDLRTRITMLSKAVEHPLPGFYLPWIRIENIMVAPKGG